MKYIIEIEDEPFVKDGRKLYKCKHFNSLVFDTIGLGILEPYYDKEICIGDEVRALDDDSEAYVVTFIDMGIDPNHSYYRGIDGEGDLHFRARHEIAKTGRHFNTVDKLFEEMK